MTTPSLIDVDPADLQEVQRGAAGRCLMWHNDGERAFSSAMRLAWATARTRNPGVPLERLGRDFREWSARLWTWARARSGDCPTVATAAACREVLLALRPPDDA